MGKLHYFLGIQYLTLTRPEISHVVNVLYQFMQNPSEDHWLGVKLIIRYVAGTSHIRLCIMTNSSLHLVEFSDADWVGCLLTRTFTISLCIFLRANCVSWASKKKHTVDKSSSVQIICVSCYITHVDYIYFEGY
uniref:Reverse transcriptase Ty1/copia-type domain-containing protein n=1 Tax=Solanum lycopersicum TaxID=4081 RepID=A0A3Q7G4G3_SOLLC